MEKQIKIILIGPGGIGKTTIRKVFFDQENPFTILKTTLDPTRGDEINFYSLGKTISIHDLAGQQIDNWLNEDSMIFNETDLVICMLDCQDEWDYSKKFLQGILNVTNAICENAKLIVFFHKIDLISDIEKKKLEQNAIEYFQKIL